VSQTEIATVLATDEPATECSSSGPLDVADVVSEARARLYAKPQRDEATGQWIRGGVGRGELLGRSEQFKAVVEPARRERTARILADRGVTPDAATVTLADAADDLAKLDLIAESFWQAVVDRGVTTTKGRTTAAVRQLLGVLDRKMALYKLLGLERQAKPVPSLDAVLAGDEPKE
jgi:hypothetical protein